MKKFLAIVLVCALLLSLAGCDLASSLKDALGKAIKDKLTDMLEDAFSGDATYATTQTKPPIREVLDLSQATVVEKFYEDYYVFTGATRQDAEDFVRQITEAGYEPFGEIEMEDGGLYQELGHGTWGEHYTVCFYKDTLVLGLDLHSYLEGDLMLLAGVPEEQIPEFARWETPENTALPDWSTASPLTLGEYNCKVLTGVSYQLVENYALWLSCRKDIYNGGGFFDNYPIEDYLFIQELVDANAEAYDASQLLVWYDGTAILAEVDGSLVDEYVFWTYLDARVNLGENYLRKELIHFRSNHGGNGSNGSSYYAFARNCTTEDFERVKASIIEKGYVEDAEETAEGGVYRYFAMYKAPCGQGRYTKVYYELILEEDGYMEAEISFFPQEGINWD